MYYLTSVIRFGNLVIETDSLKIAAEVHRRYSLRYDKVQGVCQIHGKKYYWQRHNLWLTYTVKEPIFEIEPKEYNRKKCNCSER